MILFKPEHVPMILEGRKTQTRRLWPKGKRANAGALHQCATRLFDPEAVFATVRVLRVWQEHLLPISSEDARAEGYETPWAYYNAFAAINDVDVFHLRDANPVVWCVEFELAETA